MPKTKKKSAETAKSEAPAQPSSTKAPVPVAKERPAVPARQSAAGKRYSPEAKAAIMRAAIVTRGAGKSWDDALKAAKDKGYRGSKQALVKMIRASNRRKVKRKRAAARPALKRAGRRKVRSIRRVRTATTVVSMNGLGQIQTAVDRIVRERVRAALDRAIDALNAVK